MNLNKVLSFYAVAVGKLNCFDGIAPLLIRIYLAPVFIQAGWNKIIGFDNTVAWFANAEWGLGMPFPEVMAGLAAGTEFIGGWLLLVGIFTRLISIPLLFTMFVAAISVHWQYGWPAIADPSSWLADGTILYNERIMASAEQKDRAVTILQEHGHYDWLTANGDFVILNNGIEFAATYFVMLTVLLFFGGGRFTSLDYYLVKRLK